MNIKNQLLDLASLSHKKFTSALIPNINNILGIKTPELRKIAKEISKGDWKEYISTTDKEYFEETLVEGMVIGFLKLDIAEHLEYIKNFVPKLDNWATCDSFCGALKFTKKNQEIIWNFILPYLKSDKEYEVRFAVIMFLSYFINENYIDRVLKYLNEVEHRAYYVQMGVAWAVSVCFVKFPEKTMVLLKNNNFDDFTFNKSLQKITESFRVSDENKIIIKSMKRK